MESAETRAKGGSVMVCQCDECKQQAIDARDGARYRKFVEIRDYYIWSECTPEQVAEILDDYIRRKEGRD
jgi:hypothetical protein